jgi:hypothetical protein
MIRLAFCLLTAIAIQSECVAEITKLAAKDHRVLENSSQFQAVRFTTNLPPAVIALCADENGRLAEPGQKWEMTDYITDSSLPRKRLTWAVTNDECFVVHYERGGYAHSFHVLIATLKPGETKPNVVWRGVGSSLKDFRAFLDALKSKDALDDRSDYH